MLNPQSPIPLYHQLANIISEKIKSKEYMPGSRLPSEHEMAKYYAIGRPTVRQATEQLIHKGVVERIRGSGTYVKKKLEEVDLFSLAGTSSAFKKKGINLTTQLLQDIKLKTIKSDPQNPFNKNTAYFLSRLSMVKNIPVLIEDIYFDPNTFPRLDQFKVKGYSLSQIIEENYYIKPISGKQNFSIGYLGGMKAKKLGIDEITPILIVKRYLNFINAGNVIYAVLYCKTDQFAFSQIIGGNINE